jgi:hypothetical protein
MAFGRNGPSVSPPTPWVERPTSVKATFYTKYTSRGTADFPVHGLHASFATQKHGYSGVLRKRREEFTLHIARPGRVVWRRRILMKTVAIVVALLVLASVPLAAQTPTVQVYFDENFSGSGDCPSAPPGTVLDTLYVYANNFNMFMSSIEFQIDYPAQLSWVADVPSQDALAIGTTPAGVALAWTIPQNAFEPFQMCQVLVTWQCDACAGLENTPLVVVGHPFSNQVRAVRWPDNTEIIAVGMTSLICAVVPVEETSWGRVKALYN